MKKQLVASLAAAMVLGVAGTSFAAANPFADVPAKHWAYDSVTSLAQAGIVDGYSDGKFQGDKMMSRYEMAQVVAKAMAHSDKATAAQKAAIDKLSVEFASELEGLNVRVSKIEKNASSVKITGEARVLYDTTNTKISGVTTNDHEFTIRTRLALGGNINQDWTYAGRVENNRNMKNGFTANNPDGVANNSTTFDIAYVKGHLGSIETTIGRQEFMPNYGLFLDSGLDGVKFSGGNLVKTNVYYGAHKDSNSDILGADFTYGVSKDTNIVGEIFQIKTKDTSVKSNLWELGFDTKLSADWLVKAAYGQVNTDNVSSDNKAYMVGFDYKGADKSKVGSYGAFVNYRDIQKNAVVKTTLDNATVNGFGGKGFEVGFTYVPMVNSVFTTKYIDIKASSTDPADSTAKQFRAQIEMFF